MSSFGESLKRERELREISLREIADATKISVRYLEALEQNRFDILPGGVFNKGFIRAYATFIGADGDSFVDTYLQEMAAREMAATAATEVGRQRAEGMHRPAETPKRRAATGDGAAPAAGSGNGHRPVPALAPAESRAPDRTLEKLAAALEERRAAERASTRRSGPRILAVAGSLVGGAALVFALLFVARAVTRNPSAAAPADGATAGLVRPSETAGESAPLPPQEDSGSLASGQSIVEPRADQEPDALVTGGSTLLAAASPSGRENRDETPVDRARAPMPIPPPTLTPEPAGTAQPETTPARGDALAPMDLRLEATLPVLVQVSCDGEDRLNRPLLPGETATMRCFNTIRVSATDAGALRLVVNGRSCAALGESGSRVQGFAIRTDDVASICPSSGGSDARR